MKHVVCAASSTRCVLVTGFGAFPGARSNPTALILAGLERHRARLGRLGIDLRCELLPVIYDEIRPTLKRVTDLHRPVALLHLGLAGRRQAVSIETRAINRAGPLHPDAGARQPQSQVLSVGASQSLAVTYPAAEILAAVRRCGIAAYRSIDAGDYVCNATLFASLAGRMAPQIGFVHVPRTRRGQARGGAGRPTVDALAQAVVAAVIVMGRHASRHRAGVPTARLPDDARGSRSPH